MIRDHELTLNLARPKSQTLTSRLRSTRTF